MIFGAVALAAIMAWQAGASSPFDDPDYSNTGTGIAGIASIFVFSLVFSMSFGPGKCTASSAVSARLFCSLVDLPVRDLPHEPASSWCFRFYRQQLAQQRPHLSGHAVRLRCYRMAILLRFHGLQPQ
jgi:hypothetical protein